jgi:transposase
MPPQSIGQGACTPRKTAGAERLGAIPYPCEGREGGDDESALLFLPPYSPHFNPIEKALAKLKALLREAAERTLARP